MTLIPNQFEPGQIAASNEVNDNFTAIENALGTSSTSAVLIPPGSILLGPRENMHISAEADTAYGGDSTFLHIGNNAELYNSGGWKVRRFHDSQRATAIRLYRHGIAFYVISRATGDLNAQFDKTFEIGKYNNEEYVYMEGSLTNTVTPDPAVSEDYRLTLTWLNTPLTVYENVTANYNTITRNMYNAGVPSTARAVLLTSWIRSGTTAGGMIFSRKRSGAPLLKYGFGVYAGPNAESSGQGTVFLDEDGKFIEQRTTNFTRASLYVIGYWS